MRLKTEPEDFIVEEIPTSRFEESIGTDLSKKFLVVRARKRDCAHFDLMRTISRTFSLAEADVGIGGIKDRRAVTSQLITLPNVARIRTALTDARNGSFELETHTGSATLELIGTSERRMTIGTLFGNRFDIRAVAHELELGTLENYKRGARMPNYFGSQRFGRGRENVALGYALLRGDFAFVRDTLLSSSDDDPTAFVKRISRRKRMFYVSAFQSALFNAELAERIGGGVLERIRDEEQRVKMLAKIADERVYERDYEPFTLPIVSLGSSITAFQKEALELLEITPRSFAIRQLPDMMFEPVERQAIINVSFDRFEFEEHAVRVAFSLPKGSYATVLFEQLATMNSPRSRP